MLTIVVILIINCSYSEIHAISWIRIILILVWMSQSRGVFCFSRICGEGFNVHMLQRWAEIIGQARQCVDFLKDQEVIRTVLNILQVFIHTLSFKIVWVSSSFIFILFFLMLQTNTSAASSLGQPFLSQISLIYLDMLNVYRYVNNFEWWILLKAYDVMEWKSEVHFEKLCLKHFAECTVNSYQVV